MLTALDGVVIVAYLAASFAIGLGYGRRAGRDGGEYFRAGRRLPWWLAGTSMVATTFAADTPLAVTGLVAAQGVAGNWMWWNMVAGTVLTVFFFAPLWHRADVSTDAEIAELRYGGRPAAILRGFRAVYLALPVNLIVIGWVNLAMVKIAAAVLGVAPTATMIGMLVLTAIYTTTSGLWGVVITDAFQFILAMAGSIVLCVYAVADVGGLSALVERASAHFGSFDAAFGLAPRGGDALPLYVFVIYLTVPWWASWYPGAEPGGGGYVAQRIFSAKSERDGVLATLWFAIAHYALRPWPWILTALCTVLVYPGLADPGEGYARAVVDLLPAGLRGLMVAAFAAAYMSTLSTQLNWGASYLVNDVYVRFVRPSAGAREVVRASRAVTAALAALSIGATLLLQRLGSVEGAWRLLIALGAGTGGVLMLRWYWWRVNAWSEIAAMLASLISFAALTLTGVFDPADPSDAALLTVAVTVVTTATWLVVTFATPPVEREVLASFYARIRPAFGWRPFATSEPPRGEGWPALLWRWLLGVTAVYAALFAVGRLLVGPRGEGVVLGLIAVAAFGLLARSLRRGV